MVGGMVERVKVKSPGVHAARQAFLYGCGDGRRVLRVEDLAEIGGVHPETVRRHLPAWQAEAEDILAKSSESGISLRLSKLALAKFESDRDFIRKQIDTQLAEIQDLPKLQDTLLNLVRRIAECGNPDAGEQAAALLGRFFDLVANRKAMEAHLLKLQAHWSKMAGIESLQAVAETREKTLATGRAKLALRREEAEGEPGPEGARVASPASGGGVFAKRALGSPAAPVVDLVGDDEV